MEDKMKTNVGGIDKTARIVIGLVVILAGIIFQSWWGLIGIVPLATGLASKCPVYIPFGISTNKPETKVKS
jgi:Protein of unknown function (DUF2892)